MLIHIRESVSRAGDRLIGMLMAHLGVTHYIGVDKRGPQYVVTMRKFVGDRLESETIRKGFATAADARAEAEKLRLFM